MFKTIHSTRLSALRHLFTSFLGPAPGPPNKYCYLLVGTIRERLQLSDAHSEASDFRVVIDDLELRRPLLFTNLPVTSNKVKTPMIFVGHLREEFSGIEQRTIWGRAEFQAYLLWTPKIAPVDHAGALVRVHGASGTLFNQSSFRYQVAEPTRLRDLLRDLCDPRNRFGINIDRESFNFAHAHIVRLTSWLHSALTRAITQQKQVASSVRQASQREGEAAESSALDTIVSQAWTRIAGDDDDIPPIILRDSARDDRTPGAYTFNRIRVLGDLAFSNAQHSRRIQRQVVALAQILAAYDLLDSLDPDQRERLLRIITDILKASA